jgi:type VI secretion system protein ImpK
MIPAMPPAASPPTPNIASLFSESLTAILRVRHGKQTVDDPQSFRDHMRRLLQTAMQDARTTGYTAAHIQMAVLAAVGFLDESVLNLRNAVSAVWARKPLQEELFGGHIAGETFFQNLVNLLREDNSAEVADLLELHCHCLQLGYKGRYAFGNTGELAQLLRGAEEKIGRTRGHAGVVLTAPATELPAKAREKDRVSRVLLIAALALVVLAAVCFISFTISLRSGAASLASIDARTSAAQGVQTSPTGEEG